MSSKRSAQRLLIECRHIPLVRVLFVSVIFVAAACLLVVPLSWPLKTFSLLLLFALALRTWLSRCELAGERVSLLWDGEGRWWWAQGDREYELQLGGQSYLSTWMIVLNLYDPVTGKGNGLLLFPSTVGPALFRRLTVRLKLEGRSRLTGPQDMKDAR